MRSATSLAEEQSLIQEVVQHAQLSLKGNHIDNLLNAAGQLDQLE